MTTLRRCATAAAALLVAVGLGALLAATLLVFLLAVTAP